MKKLQQSRVDWQSKPRKKSGFNKFQNFKYFVLKDILPTVNEIFNKIKLEHPNAEVLVNITS